VRIQGIGGPGTRDRLICIAVTNNTSRKKKPVDIERDICYDIDLPMSNASVNNQGGEI
jgi:hypothetical protein